jgi:hypothetical protein
MTIDLGLSNKRVWKCDVCGKRAEWGPGWQAFGSIAMQEICPNDVPTICSEECKGIFREHMNSGYVVVPAVKLRGPNEYRITGKRKGY